MHTVCILSSVAIKCLSITYVYTYIILFNHFQCGSLGCAHRAALGPISRDNFGLFGPVPPVENTSSHSCGPRGQAPYGALLISALTVEKAASSYSHSPPPPDILCCHTEPHQKSGAVLAFTQRFGHEDFILQKSLLNVLKRAWTRLFTVFKI
jgi:hypothetical protein